MVMRPFLRLYRPVRRRQLTAVILLTWAVGIGWTLLVLAATFIVGVVLAANAAQGPGGRPPAGRGNPQGAVTDGVLVAAGSFLVFLPGW